MRKEKLQKEITCFDCYHMRGKLPLSSSGAILYRLYKCRCTFCLITKGSGNVKFFRAGAYHLPSRDIPKYVDWDIASGCEHFQSMNDD